MNELEENLLNVHPVSENTADFQFLKSEAHLVDESSLKTRILQKLNMELKKLEKELKNFIIIREKELSKQFVNWNSLYAKCRASIRVDHQKWYIPTAKVIARLKEIASLLPENDQKITLEKILIPHRYYIDSAHMEKISEILKLQSDSIKEEMGNVFTVSKHVNFIHRDIKQGFKELKAINKDSKRAFLDFLDGNFKYQCDYTKFMSFLESVRTEDPVTADKLQEIVQIQGDILITADIFNQIRESLQTLDQSARAEFRNIIKQYEWWYTSHEKFKEIYNEATSLQEFDEHPYCTETIFVVQIEKQIAKIKKEITRFSNQ